MLVTTSCTSRKYWDSSIGTSDGRNPNGESCNAGWSPLTARQGHLAVPLREEPILNLGEFDGRGAFRVVVSHVIDPSALQTGSRIAMLLFSSFRRTLRATVPCEN